MTDQQQHLQQVLEQQKTLVGEINELNTQVDSKRQMALKLQGVLEYLQQLGIELPKEEEASAEEGAEAPAAEAVTPEVAAAEQLNFTVYSKEGCPYCDKVKQVLELTGSSFVVYTLGERFNREEFYGEFGEGSTFPQVTCNGQKLGGCVETIKYLQEHKILT